MSKTISQISSNAVRAALTPLIVACYDENTALNEAAGAIRRERRWTFQQQARRRLLFSQDIGRAVVALGGLPARGPSYAAMLASYLRKVKRVLTGSHEGDAYKACANATAETALAYSTALRIVLPDHIRLGLERQYAEIESDRKELRRLSWGATPTADLREPVPASELQQRGAADRVALASWSDDGGFGERRRDREKPEQSNQAPGALLANR